MGQPRPLFVFLVFSTKNFTENNCRCQRDLNSDHGSRKMSMLTTWPPPPRPEFVVVLSSLMYFYFQVYLTTFQLLHLLWLIINLEAKASGNSTVSWSYTFSIIKNKTQQHLGKTLVTMVWNNLACYSGNLGLIRLCGQHPSFSPLQSQNMMISPTWLALQCTINCFCPCWSFRSGSVPVPI